MSFMIESQLWGDQKDPTRGSEAGSLGVRMSAGVTWGQTQGGFKTHRWNAETILLQQTYTLSLHQSSPPLFMKGWNFFMGQKIKISSYETMKLTSFKSILLIPDAWMILAKLYGLISCFFLFQNKSYYCNYCLWSQVIGTCLITLNYLLYFLIIT